MTRPLRRALAALALAGVAYWLALLHVALGRELYPLADLAVGRVPLPFARRVLVPAIAGVLQRATGWPWPAIAAACEWFAWVGLLLLAGACVSLAAPALPRRWRALVGATVVVPTLTHLVLPTRFRLLEGDQVVGDVRRLGDWFTSLAPAPNVYYPWDTPSAFFMLALVALAFLIHRAPARTTIAAYLAVFAVAAVNRETVLLLVPLTIVTWTAMPSSTRLSLGGAQIGIVVAIELLVRLLLHPDANPRASFAETYEWQVKTNLRVLADPRYAAIVVPAFAAGLWAVVAGFWGTLGPFWRAVCVWLIVPNVILVLLFGLVLEYRVFAEIAPVVWLVAVAAVHEAWAGPRRTGTARA
jgi:hypothetical protein